MWRDIWFLATRTLLMTFRKRSTLILYFGLPIAGIVATFLLYGSVGTTELRVGVVNEDSGQRIAEDTVGFVKNLDHVSIVHVSRNELKEQLAANKLDSGLIIDSGFSESVLSGSPDHIAIESVKGAQVTGYMKSMLRGYIDNVAAMGKIAGGDGTTFQQIYDQYRSSAFKLTSESVNDTSLAKQMSYQSIGFLLLFMLNSAASLAELMLKHRENRTYYRILSSPINAKTYVLANIAVNAVVMLAQIVIALFFMKVVFHMDPGISVFEMFALLAIFAVVSISLSLVIIAFSKSSGMAKRAAKPHYRADMPAVRLLLSAQHHAGNASPGVRLFAAKLGAAVHRKTSGRGNVRLHRVSSVDFACLCGGVFPDCDL